MYNIGNVALTVSDLFDTLNMSHAGLFSKDNPNAGLFSKDNPNYIPQPSYVTMSANGHVGLQFTSADEVRSFLRYFGHSATTTLIGPDDKRAVLTQGSGTWTTPDCELELTIYSVIDLDSMTNDDSGTDRLIADIDAGIESMGDDR